MTHVFIDESGDLGCGERSSGVFVMVAIICDDPNALRRAMRKARCISVKKGRSAPELHAYHSSDATRIRVFKSIGRQDVRIVSLIVRKDTASAHFSEDKNVFYRACIAKLITESQEISGKRLTKKRSLSSLTPRIRASR